MGVLYDIKGGLRPPAGCAWLTSLLCSPANTNNDRVGSRLRGRAHSRCQANTQVRASDPVGTSGAWLAPRR